VKLNIKVQPKSSQQKVIKNSDNSLKVYLKAAPTDGKANKELKGVLADFYKVRKSVIKIIRGKASRDKVVEIL